MTDWFYEQAGGRHGPVSRDELKGLFDTGELSDSSLVWHANFGRAWKPLRDADVTEQLGPPPLPLAQVSQVYAWIVALVPILGMIIEHIMRDVAPEIDLKPIILFFAYSSAYILFCYLDGRQVRRSGRARDVILLGWVWFVPVYLIQRARALGAKQYLVGVWITAVVASILVNAPGILTGDVYLGLGIPRCDANASDKQVKAIFDSIPLVKQSSITAIRLLSVAEIGSTDAMRSCRATIDLSDTNSVNVNFTITKQKDNLYYEVRVTE